MFGQGLLKGLGITLRHALEKDITVQYPEERPHLYDRYRGCLAYDFPKCIACGLCVKACPNNVLSYETFKEAGENKKRVATYTIDLQYCLFCNLCVEVCPTNTLYFNHNFELTQQHRDDIKIIYHRPPELGLIPARTEKESIGEAVEVPELSPDEAKRTKQIDAMKVGLGKNPLKTLAKILPAEEDAAIMATLMSLDDKKLAKLAEFLVDDRDKAAKVAQAWVNKAKKDVSQEGGEPV